MKVLVEVYDSCKYERGSKKVGEARYDIESFEVKQISDKEIYSMGFDEVDPYGEYLILTLTGGETSTFRNSFCDMFRDYEAEAKDRALAEVEQYMDKHQFLAADKKKVRDFIRSRRITGAQLTRTELRFVESGVNGVISRSMLGVQDNFV